LYEQEFVYVIDEGHLTYRPVRIARSEPDMVIVDQGLASGDQLVEEVLQGVAPGMPARPRSMLTAEAAQ
jgi:multidrug efflux pump subunit AcrA (membrane-fusion protein)